MPGRKYTAAGSRYRYGFNGKELDKEVAGTTTYDYGFRIYSPGLGKFLSVDPLTKSYPWYTPYQFAGNKPIWAIDLDGLEEKPTNKGTTEGESTVTKSETKYAPSDCNCAEAEGYSVSKTWKWYSGNKNREATADWYSEDEYKYITQDWENGQVMQPYKTDWWDRNFSEQSDEKYTFKGSTIRNWNGYAVGENGYLFSGKDGAPVGYQTPLVLNGGAGMGRILRGVASVAEIGKIAPSLLKLGRYSVYQGLKNEVLYIGKTAFTLSERYAGSKQAPKALQTLQGLEGTIPNNGIAKGIEQIVMNLNGWTNKAANATNPVLSNKIAATANQVYIKVAEKWLESNKSLIGGDWKIIFKFQ